MPTLPLDDENLPLFTVGQVSSMLEIQQAFLRRLDTLGVVRPSRSSGGQRRYSRSEITVVQYVARLADEGMTLAAIRRVLELEAQVGHLEAQLGHLAAQHGGLEEHIGELRARIAELEQRARELVAERDALRVALAEARERAGWAARPPRPARPAGPGGRGGPAAGSEGLAGEQDG
jgi:DNA-binding transcriptional MerR regulator